MLLFWCVLCVSSLHGVLSQAQLVQPSSEIRKPGESVKMSCKTSGYTFTNYYISWIQQVPGKGLIWIGWINPSNGGTIYSSSFEGRFTIRIDNSITTAYLQIDRLSMEDSVTYYCAREVRTPYYFDVWGNGQSVLVTSAVQKAPSVFPLVPCCNSLPMDEVTIGCLSTGYLPTPVDVQWNSGSITSGIKNFPAVLGNQGTYLSTSVLTILTSDFKSNKQYVCNVNHPATGVKVDKEIKACTSKTTPPEVELMQASCGENGSVDLVCHISGYAPQDINIKWLLNGEPTSISPSNSTPYKEDDGTFGSFSKVSVPKNDWNSGDTYTCKVHHPASETHHQDTINKCAGSENSVPKVVVLPPSPKDILITKQPKIVCQVSKIESPETASITWTREDGKRTSVFTSDPELDHSGGYTIKSTLKLSLSDWSSGKTFTCVVKTNDLPSPIEKSIKVTHDEVSHPSVYLSPPHPEELSTYDFVTLTCLIKGFKPKYINVQWAKNGVTQEEELSKNTEPMQLEDEDTYFMYSTYTLEKSDWNRGAIFTCNAIHNKVTSKDIKKTRGK